MSFNINNYSSTLNELSKKLESIPKTGDKTLEIDIKKLKDVIVELRQNADELLEHNNTLRIGVVGQVKAGKSSFLNSLLFDGENVLPKAATPMTAGLTVIEYGEKNEFEVEFFNSAEWKLFEDRAAEYDSMIKMYKAAHPNLSVEDIAQTYKIPEELKSAKEMVENAGSSKTKISKVSQKQTEHFHDISEMQEILGNYVGANGKYTAVVKCLTIRLNEEKIKGIQVVDTPGVNDPVVSREERTRQFLGGCHGVFFLSYSGRFFDSTDVGFLVNRIGNQGIGSIVVIASKFDSVLQDIGGKYPDDLAGACEYCEKAFRKQMIHNVQNSDFKGQMPLLDFSSGIGYSISHKPQNRWDSTELHVVKQMKNFYPSFFDTDDDVKDVFNDLSRIDDIRVNYLDKVFKDNKDKIISDKVGGYIAGMQKKLSDLVSSRYSKSEKQLQTLRNGDRESLELQKTSFDSVIKKLRGSLNRHIKDSQFQLTNESIEIINQTFVDNIEVRVNKVSKWVHRETTFWGRDTTFSVQYDEVDVSTTLRNGKKAFEQALALLQKSWEKTINTTQNKIFTEISNVIFASEEKDVNGALDADLIRDFVRDAISEIGSYKKIDITKLLSMKQNLEDQLQSVSELSYRMGEHDESEAKELFLKRVRTKREEYKYILNQWVATLNHELRKVVEDKRKAIDAVLANEQEKMLDNISENANTYFSEIQKQMDNIDKSISDTESVLRELQDIKAILK